MSDETYKTLLDAAVEDRAKELSTDGSEAFENLAVTLLMMPYDLSVDEIDAGMTDGNGDGQIDAMFVVVNGSALSGEGAFVHRYSFGIGASYDGNPPL